MLVSCDAEEAPTARLLPRSSPVRRLQRMAPESHQGFVPLCIFQPVSEPDAVGQRTSPHGMLSQESAPVSNCTDISGNPSRSRPNNLLQEVTQKDPIIIMQSVN